MLTLANHLTVDAPISHVWRVLQNLEQYPDWHPFVSHITGTLRGGDELRVRMKLSDGREPTITFTVAEVRRHQDLVLTAHAPETGALMGGYRLNIEPVDSTRTRVS
jgi:uncharacterized protein YndB with AHSA1/START domain